MDFVAILSIFVLACCVGYYVVWSVTPALHTPLMAVTNAISSVIIVGALIASAALADRAARRRWRSRRPDPWRWTATSRPRGRRWWRRRSSFRPLPADVRGSGWAKWLGLLAVVLASVNIFGGFAVTARMLAMYKKKAK